MKAAKKILYYKSKIKSLIFCLKRDGSQLQMEKNDGISQRSNSGQTRQSIAH
jgi:hypothetical protein